MTLLRSVQLEINQTISFGVPLVASQFIYACAVFIGTAMVAQLGKDALAATMFISTCWVAVSIFFFGIINAVSILVARKYGAKDNNAMSKLMGQAYQFGVFLCLPMILILSIFPILLGWSTESPRILALATTYVHSLLWAIPGFIVLAISEQFFTGIGHGTRVLKLSLLIVVPTAVLFYFLIFGKAGLPAFGVTGIGYGLAIVYDLTALAVILYLNYSERYKRYAVFKNVFSMRYDDIKECLKIGLPMGVIQLVEMSMSALVTLWMARFSTTIFSAHQVVMQYLGLVITIIFVMAQVVRVRVEQAVARHHLRRVRAIVYAVMLLSFICLLAMIIAFVMLLSSSFDAPVLNSMEAQLLTICAVLLLCDNFRTIGFHALRGLKDIRFATWAYLSFWALGFGLAFFMDHVIHLGGVGIWLGFTLSIACGALVIFMRLQYLLREIEEGMTM